MAWWAWVMLATVIGIGACLVGVLLLAAGAREDALRMTAALEARERARERERIAERYRQQAVRTIRKTHHEGGDHAA